MKKLLVVLTIVVGLLSGCGSSSAETPEEIVKAYFNAALNGNVDEADSYFSSRAREYSKTTLYSKVNGYHKFVNDISKFDYEFKTRELSSQSVQIEVYLKNETAKTKYLKYYKKYKDMQVGEDGKIIYSYKNAPNIIFQFIIENGKWKIQVA
ncbi:hypothetical protein ACMC56_09260 [Campylobacterota bacterium DY0563]